MIRIENNVCEMNKSNILTTGIQLTVDLRGPGGGGKSGPPFGGPPGGGGEPPSVKKHNASVVNNDIE